MICRFLSSNGLCTGKYDGYSCIKSDCALWRESHECEFHDQTGDYTKIATAAGNVAGPDFDGKASTITGTPAKPIDLSKSALSVGMPTADNCGQCHFYGGGGDNVKHGDLSSALFEPSVDVDVHMSKDGAGMQCTDCHVSESHHWAGSRYNVNAAGDMTSAGHDAMPKPGDRGF